MPLAGLTNVDQNQYVSVDPVTGAITPWSFDNQPTTYDVGDGTTGTWAAGKDKPGSTKRKVTAADAADPNNSVLNAALANRKAIASKRAANTLNDDQYSRFLAGAAMQQAAQNGRNPLKDAITQRLLQQRTQGVYGY